MTTKISCRHGPVSAGPVPGSTRSRLFLLTRVQPALNGLMDGALSTLLSPSN
jgi:hypothetical protein